MKTSTPSKRPYRRKQSQSVYYNDDLNDTCTSRVAIVNNSVSGSNKLNCTCNFCSDCGCKSRSRATAANKQNVAFGQKAHSTTQAQNDYIDLCNTHDQFSKDYQQSRRTASELYVLQSVPLQSQTIPFYYNNPQLVNVDSASFNLDLNSSRLKSNFENKSTQYHEEEVDNTNINSKQLLNIFSLTFFSYKICFLIQKLLLNVAGLLFKLYHIGAIKRAFNKLFFKCSNILIFLCFSFIIVAAFLIYFIRLFEPRLGLFKYMLAYSSNDAFYKIRDSKGKFNKKFKQVVLSKSTC
jgi:hypothetical protein